MRAWEIAEFGWSGLRLVDRPDPEPGPGQVVVRLLAAALNSRDLLLLRGEYDPRLRLPVVPGSDGVGEVVAVGQGVSRFGVGDRVLGCFFPQWIDGPVSREKTARPLGSGRDGVLSELFVLEAEGAVLAPPDLSDEQAATLPCAALTAWSALFELGSTRRGETVVVQGTGGVAVAALQLGVMSGARVIVTSSSDGRLERARELGATEGINYRTCPEWHEEVRRLTDGLGADHILELGGAGTLARSLRAVRMGGRVSLIGVLAGRGEVDTLPAVMRQITMQGVFVGSRAMLERMLRAVEESALKPVVGAVFPFEALDTALLRLQAGGVFGKVVLLPG